MSRTSKDIENADEVQYILRPAILGPLLSDPVQKNSVHYYQSIPVSEIHQDSVPVDNVPESRLRKAVRSNPLLTMFAGVLLFILGLTGFFRLFAVNDNVLLGNAAAPAAQPTTAPWINFVPGQYQPSINNNNDNQAPSPAALPTSTPPWASYLPPSANYPAWAPFIPPPTLKPTAAPSEVPTETPTHPTEAPTDAPTNYPGFVPGVPGELGPGEVAGVNPGQTPGEIPGQVPEPVPAPGDLPPGEVAGIIPGQVPGEVPGALPESEHDTDETKTANDQDSPAETAPTLPTDITA